MDFNRRRIVQLIPLFTGGVALGDVDLLTIDVENEVLEGVRSFFKRSLTRMGPSGLGYPPTTQEMQIQNFQALRHLPMLSSFMLSIFMSPDW